MVLRKSRFRYLFRKNSNLITEEIIMFKKILSLALVAMLLMSVCAVSFSAAQVEVSADGAASAVAEQGADSDAASQGAESEKAATGADVIKYDNSVTKWAGPVQFYIYDVETGAELIAWGSKKLNGDDEGGDIWSKDVSGYGLESGKQYCIIFADATSGDQTYDLMMDTSCIGDTGKATGNTIENPVDSNKTAKEAKWASNSLGPRKQVTSIGNVVGETLPANESAYDTFVKFLTNTLSNAKTYKVDTGEKTEQQLIDDTAKALGLGKSDVEKAIAEAKVTTEWSKDKSSLSDESDAGANDKGGSGSSDSGSSDSGSTGSSGSSGSSGSGSSSSSKSGSASNTQTGQTETVLFIMLGVMVAAAGVIFFARKKERA